MQDPYDVLGVGRDATPDDIKAAFRRLAQKYHPDRNPGDDQASARFKELNGAYQVLSDPAKRQVYDRFGARGAAGGVAGGSPFDFADLGNLNLEGLFGDLLRGFGVNQEPRGDIKLEITIGFEDAARGCDKELTYERTEGCSQCRGSGSAEGFPGELCHACAGRGKVRYQQGILPLPTERACGQCRGTGRLVTHPCEACRGAGLCSRSRTIEISIPPGVEHGATRLVERGGNTPKPGKPAGDLELTIKVASHPFFRRNGDDIASAVPVTFVQAALGSEVSVPTLDGHGKLRIPPGTQPGTVLRIRGKGVPHRGRSGRGDQLVEVQLEVPTQLTDRQRELLRALADELGDDVQPQQKSFMQKLKGLLG